MSFVKDQETVEMLKKSRKIGELQPVVVEKGKNLVLLGRHRKFSYPEWFEVEREVKNDLHREFIIVNGNVQRKPSEEETAYRLKRIAEILVSKGIPPEQVCTVMMNCNWCLKNDRLAECEVCKECKGEELLECPMPYSEQFVRRLLPHEFKMTSKARSSEPKSAKPSFAKPVRTAMDISLPFQHEGIEASFPFGDCKCAECQHKNACY
jgi:hypothetical protein